MDKKKHLRRNATDAERRLWFHLRGNQLGCKFRRQHELLGYIVDFVCLERGIVVELDGCQHADDVVYDERRTRALAGLGLRVLRFWNDQALLETEAVLAAIDAALHDAPPPHPNPLPRLRRGRGSRTRVAQSVKH